MNITFQRATKSRGLLRLCFMGPPGSGKTYSSLEVAKGLVGDSVAVIDTERGSASLYAGTVADFDVVDLESYEVEKYLEAIRVAGKAGFKCLVIDSLSHAWSGAGGLLERVDSIARRTKTANSFAAWRDVTPLHNQLVDAILAYPGHVIVTMRSKVEYVLEEDSRGKKVPRKVGMAPIQRDGLEYEFTVVIDMDSENYGAVTKTRCPAISGAVIHKPGAKLAATLLGWLNDGGEPHAVPAPVPVQSDVRSSSLDKAIESCLRSFPEREAEIFAIANNAIRSDATKVNDLRAWFASARTVPAPAPQPAAVPQTSHEKRLVAQAQRLAASIRQFQPSAVAEMEALIADYASGQNGLDDLYQADLNPLVTALENILNAVKK